MARSRHLTIWWPVPSVFRAGPPSLPQILQIVAASLGLFACAGERDHGAGSPFRAGASGAPPPLAVDAHLPDIQSDMSVEQGPPGLCLRPGSDVVRDAFCGKQPSTIGSLSELQHSLGISPDPYVLGAQAPELDEGEPTGVVLSGHSTALSGRLVSPINPRAFMLSSAAIMAYQRGVQQVEVAARDRQDGFFNFYLITFEQACNQRAGGCVPGDLYTPRIERAWRKVRVFDDEDLKNSPADCRQCHQRGSDAPILLMRELRSPWTHFFGPAFVLARDRDVPGISPGQLPADYHAAKGTEPYGGVPAEAIDYSLPILLEVAVGESQPLLFDASTIFAERWPQGDDGFSEQPQQSPTWQRAFKAFQRGESLALPFYAGRATDPDKQARLAEAYRSYREGGLAAEDLPDLSDIYPDDPLTRAEIGLQTVPGASPAEALIQACGSCHNDVLDQSISRARFSIALDRMDDADRARVIDRIKRATHERGVMPPPEARQLDDQARAALIEYLRQPERPTAENALLNRAAELGMAGAVQAAP